MCSSKRRFFVPLKKKKLSGKKKYVRKKVAGLEERKLSFFLEHKEICRQTCKKNRRWRFSFLHHPHETFSLQTQTKGLSSGWNLTPVSYNLWQVWKLISRIAKKRRGLIHIHAKRLHSTFLSGRTEGWKCQGPRKNASFIWGAFFWHLLKWRRGVETQTKF